MSTELIEILLFFVYVIPIGMGIIIFLLGAIWMSIEDSKKKEAPEHDQNEITQLHA